MARTCLQTAELFSMRQGRQTKENSHHAVYLWKSESSLSLAFFFWNGRGGELKSFPCVIRKGNIGFFKQSKATGSKFENIESPLKNNLCAADSSFYFFTLYELWLRVAKFLFILTLLHELYIYIYIYI